MQWLLGLGVLRAQGEPRYKGESEDVTFKEAVVSTRESVRVRHHGEAVRTGGRVPMHEGERSMQRQCKRRGGKWVFGRIAVCAATVVRPELKVVRVGAIGGQAWW